MSIKNITVGVTYKNYNGVLVQGVSKLGGQNLVAGRPGPIIVVTLIQ